MPDIRFDAIEGIAPVKIVLPAVAAALAMLALASVASARERLVLEPYPANPPWKQITNQANAVQFLWEYVPADQSGDVHTEILDAQGFYRLKGVDPAGYLQGLFGRTESQCNSVRVNGPVRQVEGGYNVAYAQIYCGRQNGQSFGLSMFFKVIAGSDGLYVIEREVTTPGSDTAGALSFDKDHAQDAIALLKDQSTANHYLSTSVYLCADASTDRRCGTAP